MDVQWEWFTFPFEDDDLANKLLVAALVGLASILVIPIFIFYGYFIRVLRTVIDEDRMELPPFDDIGGYLADGFQYFLIGLVYSLPLWVVTGSLFGVMFILPLLGLPFVEEAPGITAALTGVSFIAVMVGFVFVFPISLVVAYFSQVAIVRFAAERTLASAFDFRAVWKLGSEGFRQFIIALVLIFVVSFAVNLAIQVAAFTIILLCLLPFVFGPLLLYIFAVQGVLLGKAYRAAIADRDRPMEPVPAV